MTKKSNAKECTFYHDLPKAPTSAKIDLTKPLVIALNKQAFDMNAIESIKVHGKLNEYGMGQADVYATAFRKNLPPVALHAEDMPPFGLYLSNQAEVLYLLHEMFNAYHEISANAFAKSCNISPSYLSLLLSGKRPVTQSILNKINPTFAKYYSKLK